MKIQISVLGVVFAVVSIIFARFVTSSVAPFLQETLDLTQKQEEWIFLLLVWAIGYWGYALKSKVDLIVKQKRTKVEPAAE